MYKITRADLEFVEVCPACCNSDWKHIALVKLGEDSILRTSECINCNLNHRTIRPSLNWFLKVWEERDRHQRREQVTFLNPTIEKNRYDRYSFIYDQLHALRAGASLIDIGAGTGGGTIKFQENGFDCTILEPDSSRRAVAADTHLLKTDGRSIYDDVQDLGPFDTCLLIHSLEHFHHPKSALDQVYKIMADDGLLYVEVPDYVEYVQDWQDALYLAHISNFSEYNLVKIAESAGFKAMKRAFPPVGKDGLSHLAMIFRKTKADQVFSNICESSKSMSSMYCPERSSLKTPVEFIIPAVNDISLCYKPEQKVLDSVRDNYNTRSIKKMKTNVYSVF